MGLQGKRAISDHMKEAVTYIKHLQNKIKELSAERHKLKELSTSNIALEPESGTSTASPPSYVLVRPCSGGVEIMVNSSLKEQGLPLSRALQVLLEKGLAVYSCVSSKVDERLIYTIHAEVLTPLIPLSLGYKSSFRVLRINIFLRDNFFANYH